eukprot:1187921-Prorocentrum_minimum.AAC.3
MAYTTSLFPLPFENPMPGSGVSVSAPTTASKLTFPCSSRSACVKLCRRSTTAQSASTQTASSSSTSITCELVREPELPSSSPSPPVSSSSALSCVRSTTDSRTPSA